VDGHFLPHSFSFHFLVITCVPCFFPFFPPTKKYKTLLKSCFCIYPWTHFRSHSRSFLGLSFHTCTRLAETVIHSFKAIYFRLRRTASFEREKKVFVLASQVSTIPLSHVFLFVFLPSLLELPGCVKIISCVVLSSFFFSINPDLPAPPVSRIPVESYKGTRTS